MRFTRIIFSPLLATFTVSAFLVLPGLFQNILPAPFRSTLSHPDQQQSPMNPGPVQPPSSPNNPPPSNENAGDSTDGSLTISDILPKTRSINIFASLTRDVSSISSRLESPSSPSSNSTLLAPLNSVMQSLPRKPWEDLPGDNSAISAASDSDKAAANLQRFVEEHVVPMSPWREGKEGKVKTVGGTELWWEKRDGGKRVVMPGGIEVDGVLGRVGNGEVWALKGVVNYR